jgi:hypothetical protein
LHEQPIARGLLDRTLELHAMAAPGALKQCAAFFTPTSNSSELKVCGVCCDLREAKKSRAWGEVQNIRAAVRPRRADACHENACRPRLKIRNPA